jgi:hypothetical protein
MERLNIRSLLVTMGKCCHGNVVTIVTVFILNELSLVECINRVFLLVYSQCLHADYGRSLTATLPAEGKATYKVKSADHRSSEPKVAGSIAAAIYLSYNRPQFFLPPYLLTQLFVVLQFLHNWKIRWDHKGR